jgi:hypothetical protein
MLNRAMSSFQSGRVRVALKAVAAILALATLLAFPIRSPHQFVNHFRTSSTELRRAMVRLVAVAQPQRSTAGEVADHFAHAASAARVIVETSYTPVAAPSFVTAPVPLPRMLMRLKLGSTSSDPRDPLL